MTATDRHPGYCTFAGKTYDETNGQPSDCLCPPEGGWPPAGFRTVVVPAATDFDSPQVARVAPHPSFGAEVYHPDAVQIGMDAFGQLMSIGGIADPPGVGVLVVQQPVSQTAALLLAWAREHQVATVVDVTDRPSTPAMTAVLAKACALADLVTTVDRKLLRRYAPHGRGEVTTGPDPDLWARARARRMAMAR